PHGLYVLLLNSTTTNDIYTLALHDALPISWPCHALRSEIAEADRTLAMQPFAAAAAAAALAVLVDAGVVGLVLGLADGAVDADVVHLHVAAAAVVGELHQRAARCRGGGRVVRHAGGERPAGHRRVVDLERDVLAARGAARAHHDG